MICRQADVFFKTKRNTQPALSQTISGATSLQIIFCNPRDEWADVTSSHHTHAHVCWRKSSRNFSDYISYKKKRKGLLIREAPLTHPPVFHGKNTFQWTSQQKGEQVCSCILAHVTPSSLSSLHLPTLPSLIPSFPSPQKWSGPSASPSLTWPGSAWHLLRPPARQGRPDAASTCSQPGCRPSLWVMTHS